MQLRFHIKKINYKNFLCQHHVMSQSQGSWEALQRRLATPPGKDGDSGGVEEDVPPTQVLVPRSPPYVSTDVLVSVCLVSFGPGSDICGGRVGGTASSAKFCTAPCVPGTTTCRFAAHTQKARLQFPAYYICTPKVGVAFTQPCVLVPRGKLGNMVAAAMSESRSLREWNDLFSVLNCFPEEMSQTEAVENISKVTRRTQIGLTPMRDRNRSESEDLNDDIRYMADPDSWSASGTKTMLEYLLMEDDVVADPDVVSHVMVNWNKLIHQIIKHHKELETSDKSVRSLLEEVDVKVLKTSVALGVPGNDVPALTVWNSITEVMGMIKTQDALVRTVMESNTELRSHIEQIRKMIDNTMFPVMQDLVLKMEGFAGRNGVGNIDLNPALLGRLQLCEAELEKLTLASRCGTPGSTSGDPGAEAISLRLLVGELKDSVALLKNDNLSLRRELNTEAIQFGGFTFQSDESYLAFVRDHVKSNRWTFCYDFISIFELHFDQSRMSDEALQSNHLIGRLGYKDLPSARIDNSFNIVIPKIFGPEQDPKDPSKKMAKLVTIDVWDHPTTQSGLKEDIKSFFEMNTNSLINQIETICGINERATMFFTHMVNGIVTFWNGLDTWISRFEKDLTAQMGGDNPTVHKESVWKLICWMLHAMFKEMLNRRQPGRVYAVFATGTDRSEEELQLKCASIIHGTVAAHKFMKELLADGFIRHPIFASTMVEYLLKNKAAHVSLVELSAKYSALDSRVKGNQVALDKLAHEKRKGAPPAQNKPGGNGNK